jgi:hypothetical protein
MSARTESLTTELANMTIPTVPATAFEKRRGGHDRDRHRAGTDVHVHRRARARARNCP